MAKEAKQIEKPIAVVGKKLGMTQVWNESNEFVPVTVVQVTANVVTQIKTVEKDGYNAIQLATGDIPEDKIAKKVNKPTKGHFDKAGVTPKRHLYEIRTNAVDEFKVGEEINVDVFEKGAYVDVTADTKGKGFAGVMKRHGFHGVGASHGAHKNHRKPGSIGEAATPSKVYKGLKMAGRMGNKQHTVQNLLVQGVDKEKQVILIKGAVSGANNSLVTIKTSVKKGTDFVKAGEN